MTELISKPYAARAPQVDRHEQGHDADPGGRSEAGQGDTVYLCVVDKDRNCVSLIQSNYFGFGSGLVPGDLGFALQNRGTLVRARRDARQSPRAAQTAVPHDHPALVTKDGKPWLVFGVMGGDMQPQGQVQVLVNLIDFGMNVQEAGEAPRLEHLGSATPTGLPGSRDGGTVHAERGISDESDRGADTTRSSRDHRADQRRRLSRHSDRSENERAARRLRGAQGRLRRRLLNHARAAATPRHGTGKTPEGGPKEVGAPASGIDVAPARRP